MAEASFSSRANWPWASSINVTADASSFRPLLLDRLGGSELTPNHMKYPSPTSYMPVEILGLFKAERSRSLIVVVPQGHAVHGYLSCCSEEMRTNLVLFRLPSSDGILAVVLFCESHDLTPSTRSSTSESVSVSSPLRKQGTGSVKAAILDKLPTAHWVFNHCLLEQFMTTY